MTTEGGWRGQTKMQNEGTYRLFLDVCGDLPASSYTKSHLSTLYSSLRDLPAMYGKAPRWKGMSVAQICEQARGDAELPKLTMKTIKRHMSALGGLFSYLKQHGHYQGDNPAHGFKFPQKGRQNQKRLVWDSDSLKRLFGSPVWTGCKSAASRHQPGTKIIKDDKYWLPLLGIYHGNRLEEFAQLVVGDIRSENGIWYFDINDDGDKRVKNEQSKRRVPVHPALLRGGFLEYVQQVAPSPQDQVFPELKAGGADGKLGHSFTKWFTRYREKIGVYQKGMDYHSFRHNVTTKLYEAGVSDVVVNQLTGHEGKGTSQTIYNKGVSLTVLLEAISKVEVPEVDQVWNLPPPDGGP